MSDNYAQLEDYIAKQEAEIERLRVALHSLTDGYKYPSDVVQIARAAFAGTAVQPTQHETLETGTHKTLADQPAAALQPTSSNRQIQPTSDDVRDAERWRWMVGRLRVWERDLEGNDALSRANQYINQLEDRATDKPADQPVAARMAQIETLMRSDPAPGTPDGDELVRLATEQEQYEKQTPAMRFDALLQRHVDDYEFRGDEGDYRPNETERMLLTDFAMGLAADDEFLSVAAEAWAARASDKPAGHPAAARCPRCPTCDTPMWPGIPCGRCALNEAERAAYKPSATQSDADDAMRFRWLMQHHGETIRKAIAPGKPGDVVTVKIPADKPAAEVCPNCDTALPEGCGGLFKDDGEACWLNRAADNPSVSTPADISGKTTGAAG